MGDWGFVNVKVNVNESGVTDPGQVGGVPTENCADQQRLMDGCDGLVSLKKPLEKTRSVSRVFFIRYFMINKIYKAILVAALVFVAGTSVNAAIVISNFNLTSNSVNFDISGTFSTSTPPNYWKNVLLFVNPSVNANPGFALSSNFASSSYSFTGSKPLTSIKTADTSLAAGDYFTVAFGSDFAVGETINGSVAATWGSTAFNPLAVSSLNVFWGINIITTIMPVTVTADVDGGRFLTSVVPEPSSLSLLLAGGAVLMAGRRRKSD